MAGPFKCPSFVHHDMTAVAPGAVKAVHQRREQPSAFPKIAGIDVGGLDMTSLNSRRDILSEDADCAREKGKKDKKSCSLTDRSANGNHLQMSPPELPRQHGISSADISGV